MCLVLFAARLSVFCVLCLSCVIFACCACSGPMVTAYLGAASLRRGWGRPPPSPLVPACSFLASWWTVPHARSAVLVLPAGNPTRFDGLLDSRLWTGRLLSYCEVALLGFCCLGWRWGAPVLVTCVCVMFPSCVFPVSPQEISLPTRFRALSYRTVTQLAAPPCQAGIPAGSLSFTEAPMPEH